MDAFVQSVGTAASLRGLAEALRGLNPDVNVVAVEPRESAVLSGGPPGAHKIDGVGAGFVVPLWHDGVADHIEQVSTDDALTMALRLAREEGLFAGTSTGANVVAALRTAERLGPGATVVTVMCDTGMKYLKTYGQEVSRRRVRLAPQLADDDPGLRQPATARTAHFEPHGPAAGWRFELEVVGFADTNDLTSRHRRLVAGGSGAPSFVSGRHTTGASPDCSDTVRMSSGVMLISRIR